MAPSWPSFLELISPGPHSLSFYVKELPKFTWLVAIAYSLQFNCVFQILLGSKPFSGCSCECDSLWLITFSHYLSFPRSSKSRLIELPCWGVLFPPAFSVLLSLFLPDSHIIHCYSTATGWSQIWGHDLGGGLNNLSTMCSIRFVRTIPPSTYK